MADYTELLAHLRVCHDDCARCPMMYDEQVEQDLVREHCAAWDAADAIERLQNELEYTSRQYELALEDLEKAEQPGWIPVTERLPEPKTSVLVCRKTIRGDRVQRIDVCPYLGDGVFCLLNVTHWMPLPEPPKEETE